MKNSINISALAIALASIAAPVLAEGLVAKIVNAPLSATGTLAGARVGINVYLQSDAAMGDAFMNPEVIGYGIPEGGRIEIEMAGDYERDWGTPLAQSSIMMVTGTPQQGLPGAAIGYTIGEEDDENTFIITSTEGNGLMAENIKSGAPGAANDRVRQRGIKVLHIGFQESAFDNAGTSGTVNVRIIDADGNVVNEGSASIDFLSAAQPQILPTNFPNAQANHNWQNVATGTRVGMAEGTIPLTYMLYGQSDGTDRDSNYAYKGGLNGVGVISSADLAAAGFDIPAALTRFSDGLVLQDTNGDNVLDPAVDTIIGGVTIAAPNGATGFAIQNLDDEMGNAKLSVPTSEVAEKPGNRWGGSMLMLTFTTGDKAGQYNPTVTLLADPSNINSGDGSSYTYTVIAN